MVIVSHAYHINNLIQLKDHVRQSVLEDRCIQQTDNIVSIAQDSHDHLILTLFVMNDALLQTLFEKMELAKHACNIRQLMKLEGNA